MASRIRISFRRSGALQGCSFGQKSSPLSLLRALALLSWALRPDGMAHSLRIDLLQAQSRHNKHKKSGAKESPAPSTLLRCAVTAQVSAMETSAVKTHSSHHSETRLPA